MKGGRPVYTLLNNNSQLDTEGGQSSQSARRKFQLDSTQGHPPYCRNNLWDKVENRDYPRYKCNP